jgi:glycerophosphoryl diester phosphodiesterase
MRDKVLVASFSHITLDKFRGRCPEVATSASTNELIKFISINSLSPGAATLPGTDAVQVKSEFLSVPVITRRNVSAAKHLELPIHAWTVNRLKEMRRVTSLGVDGIITDFPGPLLSLLGR